MPSIVEYFGDHERYKCGYCGCADSNYSRGLWAHSLTVKDYQDLIDRGWRRSGQYCYKPTMDLTCCPLYTVRCLATDIQLRKSHKKILKNMKKFLSGGKDEMAHSSTFRKAQIEGETEIVPAKASRLVETAISFEPKKGRSSKSSKNLELTVGSPISKETVASKVLLNEENGDEPPMKKAKQRRLERKIEKLRSRGIDFVPRPKIIQNQKSLEEYFEEEAKECKSHTLSVTLVRSSPASREFRQSLEESHRLYVKYQVTIHGDKASECSMSQYERFLVKSPLKVDKKDDSAADVYGSYHQQYRIDGKLVAVGVIDILPSCMSSVYFYYDTDYQFLSLGTYASLREIALTQSLSHNLPNLRWYYLGFYIHSCQKMRYKGQYVPSFLLCPEAMTWQPIEKCLPLLEKSKYARLESNTQKKDDDAKVEPDQILVLHQSRAMTYSNYKALRSDADDETEVYEYAGLVGAEVAERALLFRE